MIVNARIDKVIPDGYERCINIIIESPIVGSLWCYFVDTDVYADSTPVKCSILVGESKLFRLTIDWVNNYTIANNEKETSYKQPIDESSHLEAIALVVGKIDEYTLTCDLGNLNGVNVEFENKFINVNIGDKIKFAGNLKAELT